MEDGNECILPGGVFLRENQVGFFLGGGVLRQIVTLVTVLRLFIISEAHKYPPHHLLIHQTIRTVDNTHQHTVNNRNISLFHFHQQLNYIVFECLIIRCSQHHRPSAWVKTKFGSSSRFQ